MNAPTPASLLAVPTPRRVPASRRTIVRLVLALGIAASGLLIPGGSHVRAADEAPVVEIRRFSQVDERLLRGGQPDRAGYMALRAIGVRTIVNLRREHDERQLVESLGFRYVSIPLDPAPFGVTVRMPDDAVRQFLAVLDDPNSGPVFVHCQRGADRTGVAVGLYRIARQQWDARAAYAEARRMGMRWWYAGFRAQLAEFTPPPLATVVAGEAEGGRLLAPGISLP